MTVRELSNFLFVCEDTFYGAGVGCGAEFLVEQVSSIRDAVAVAADNGWRVEPSGEFAVPRQWFCICGPCNVVRARNRDAWLKRQEAAAAAGLGKR